MPKLDQTVTFDDGFNNRKVIKCNVFISVSCVGNQPPHFLKLKFLSCAGAYKYWQCVWKEAQIEGGGIEWRGKEVPHGSSLSTRYSHPLHTHCVSLSLTHTLTVGPSGQSEPYLKRCWVAGVDYCAWHGGGKKWEEKTRRGEEVTVMVKEKEKQLGRVRQREWVTQVERRGVYLYFTTHMDWTQKQPGKPAALCVRVCVRVCVCVCAKGCCSKWGL